METLRRKLKEYIALFDGLETFCDRCLRTERWDGNVVLMVVDAAFTSIGLSYFASVVPKVEEFHERFVSSGKVKSLRDLPNISYEELKSVWSNRRSWNVAKDIASYLSSLGDDDKVSLRRWAAESKLEGWREDPIGHIKGVGINTYQYLRMMGGVDTIMPDKIVKRFVNKLLVESGLEPVTDDMEFIKTTESIAKSCGYRPIELCWLSWLVQGEGERTHNEKYARLLSKI